MRPLRHAVFPFLVPTALLGGCTPGPGLVEGVSLDLARHRSRTLSGLRYELAFTIPAEPASAVAGRATITFHLRSPGAPIVLDFAPTGGALHEVRMNGTAITAEWTRGHIRIPAHAAAPGENTVEITFTAGGDALNRRDDYLYTLFVPDRAATAFPCFDQPDLKGRVRLTLTVPTHWVAVSNAPAASVDTAGASVRWRFAETPPLSTYLFAFATGVFAVDSAQRAGRLVRLFHREWDTARVAQNRDSIFALQARALDWLERYTGIPYPFDKFDAVAIPSFQFGGMEHPGTVFYNAASLFLDSSATQSQRLGRASLIAHETAHMWFGDLVTMRWFDDVWMKEVFANFMAAKVVHPIFPGLDHDLRFYLTHYPAAYAVDRTDGTHPIRQELGNLRDAASLYGAIIYQKAPIVMRTLEYLVGDSTLRDGLREYLLAYQFGNASWTDLIALLDQRTPYDLRAWSTAWVERAGRPTIRAALRAERGDGATLELRQEDPAGRRRLWPQRVATVIAGSDTPATVVTDLGQHRVTVQGTWDAASVKWVLPGARGVAYGRIALEPTWQAALLADLDQITDPIQRSVAWTALWEAVLEGTLPGDSLVGAALRLIPKEPEELLLQRVLADATRALWRFVDPDALRPLAGRLEAVLWRELEREHPTSRKSTLWDAYVGIALSTEGVARLAAVWRGEGTIRDLPLSERQRSRMAQELAVRGVPDAAGVLDEALAQIQDPDRRARFAFVMPALSSSERVRDSLFTSFRDRRNRAREPWVIEALGYLNHPLRAPASERYIAPGLALLEDIAATGDIFFPLNWLHALLDGHRSRTAAAHVRRFLDERPSYPPRLRAKILQAADELFRAAGLR